jgi:hypothetical protein
MFTSFEENDCPSDMIMFASIVREGYFGMIKLLSLLINAFLIFYLLILWTTICCTYHNFVRWATIVCSLTMVWQSLGDVMAPTLLVVS